MRFDYIPKDARPYEAAILILYYELNIRKSENIKRVLNYKTVRTIQKVKKKHIHEKGKTNHKT